MTVHTATTTIMTFRAPEGCQAHLIIDRATDHALILDPRLDQVEEILRAARLEGARIRYALDTHTHADHLSGVAVIARQTGAQILRHPRSRADGHELQDGSVFQLGETEIQALHSPGHTPDSLSLLLDGHLFTGDALFAGGAGRTDFMGGNSGDLYETFRRFEQLPEDTIVHPGHDYVGRPTTTIGTERRENSLMAERDREALASRLDVKAPLPANMKSILGYNTSGPSDEWVSPLEMDAIRGFTSDGLRIHIVDVRSASEFRSRHIESAVSIPLDEIESRTEEIPQDGEIVLVCNSGVRSQEAARLLGSRGRPSRQLDGGMVAWNRMDLPTVGRGHLPVERQVQLTAGSAVLAGTLLSALSPWFLVIPGFFGAGLVFAGTTGTCGLASVLSRMPWNRHERDEEQPRAACAAVSTCAAGPTQPSRQS